MLQDNIWFECDDAAKLFLHRWLPGEFSETHEDPRHKPLAVVHIVHGMAEHSGRYIRLAEKLTNAGIEVWAADQRGHGKTANLEINAPDKGGLLGHCTDAYTFDRVTADIYNINKEIRKKHPQIPLLLLGHSWGSFIAQNYIETSDNGDGIIDGCILSGTRGPGGMKVKAGKILMAALKFIIGKRKGSDMARAASDGPYNKPFSPNRTSFDWISRDEAAVDAYCKDPCSGNLCSMGFYFDLIKGLNQIHKAKVMLQIRKELPLYIFCGSADPVGEMGASPTALVNKYRFLNIKDIEFVLYPGARHETLNETNREEVMDALLSWILRHIHLPASEGTEA